MSNKVKDIDIKIRTDYFFNDIIIIKNFDPNRWNRWNVVFKMFLFTILDMQRSKMRIM